MTSPEGQAHFEFQKMQLINSLGTVAEHMRQCANHVEQFAQLVSHVHYGAGAMQPLGQFAVPVAPAPVPAAGRKRKAQALETTDGKKARGAKKLKDPNAPKRPASSYLIFQNDVRSELRKQNPNMPNNELLTMIAKLWSEMPKEKKQEYEDRQKAAKENWLAEKAAYDHRSSPDTVATPVAQTPVAPAAIPATNATEESSDDSSDDGSSSAESSDEEGEKEEEVPAPPSKRTKKGEAVKSEQAPAKSEKKSKKSKA
ncbi:HMG-box [Wolfiporia cocos MD-104 SS10]|uniref:HMG-box n=1 Tax=Wolfiporia cocos (strain MD-104) TaxID=742152 RepID=A0A2H3JXU2_WOLCO|nr:HMG-box [Wolfiporia cocos MD-104 SS10]